MRRVIGLSLLTMFSLAFVRGQTGGPQVLEAEAHLAFPDEIVFTLQADSDAVIEVVELEYGLMLRACATDVNRAIPEDLEPSTEVDAEWVWNMRRTGSLPPGARLWWRWHLVDAAGREVRTEIQWLTWLDDVHPWRMLESEGVVLHWYEGSESFAQSLLDVAIEAKRILQSDIGAHTSDRAHLYIYNDTETMREAVLFEHGWTGALAFSDYGIVIIGINQSNLEWGRDTIAHELAHVIVASAVSHCYSRMPVWLNEGLAVYAEGALDAYQRSILDQAIADGTLFSVRSLSDDFAEHADRASLSYAQSYSLVTFLIETYGQDKILALLEAFQAGYRYDNALMQVYDFDADGLESRWREWIGAAPSELLQEGPQPTPTIFPTIQPYMGSPSTVPTSPHQDAEQIPIGRPAGESPKPQSEDYRFIGWAIVGIAVLFVFVFLLRHLIRSSKGGVG